MRPATAAALGHGTHGTLYQGATIPALDTGGPGEVFSRHGSSTWVGDLTEMIIGAIGAGLWTWWVPIRSLRRRRRALDVLIPQA